MKHKAVESLVPLDAERPPLSGRGSTRDAWRAWAVRVSIANRELAECIDLQVAAIAERDAEIAYLKSKLRDRQPKGSKSPLPQTSIDRIEFDLRHGNSTRSIGKRYGVSAMTVQRIKKRMEAREAESVTLADDT